ncbi:unnamed protein product, partial [Rotaria magnacalcarata]
DIDDEEEFDDEQDEPKPNVVKPANQSSPSSLSSGSNSSLKLPTSKLHATNNGHCNDDDDDEEGLIKNSSQKLQQQNLVEFMHRLQANPLNTLSGSNGLITA